MNIWIISEGEPLPIDTYYGRLMRAGMFATQLSQLGNKIIWWTSTYLHYEKKYVARNTKSINVNPNLKIMMLHSEIGYKRNISFNRIKYSLSLARQFVEQSKDIQKPDVIYCSWPLIDFAYESVRYGKENSIPTVIDIRDFWPDIFIQPFPIYLQSFARIAIKFLFGKKTAFTMKNATVTIGVIPKALEFAQSHGRELKTTDHVIHLSYDSTSVTPSEEQEALELWASYGVTRDKCIVSYIGAINNRVADFDTIIEAVELNKNSDVLFVFCGDGEFYKELQAKTMHLKNVILPGYRNRAEIQVLLRLSKFGLLAYRNTDDFVDALPNKFGEYLSQGVVVLTALRGASRKLLEDRNCGKFYSDAKSLVIALENIQENSDLLAHMSQNAMKLFHEEFDASVIYGQFYEFLSSLKFVGSV